MIVDKPYTNNTIDGDHTMQRLNKTEIEHIASKILKHLYENPGKKDSLKGICEWWLLEEIIDQAIEVVSVALELLLSKKLILEKNSFGSEKVYQINSVSKKEIFKIVKLGMDKTKLKVS
jgi:hypothetical protein